MIQLDVNGVASTIDPQSIEELSRAILSPLPQDHGVTRVWVDGQELPGAQLDRCNLATARQISVESAPLAEIAKDAVAETTEWIGRICRVLDSIAGDYRRGHDRKATERLGEVADALHVLAHLLHGIGSGLIHGTDAGDGLEVSFNRAYAELLESVEAIVGNISLPSGGDPVVLADQVGYALPRCLSTFRYLLERVRT